jgi:tetratricopeptide (TPR) repeat protein
MTTSTYHIPFSKNRYFVGRRTELARLEQELMEKRECQKISIVGLGGTGKTQLALQFAYTVKTTCPEVSIFWLPALSMDTFEQACADIARALHITQIGGGEDPKELVKEHLSAGRAGRWLLILDNADDQEILFGTEEESKGIVDYLPASEDGITLFTTRTAEVAVSLTRSDVLELGAMDEHDAVDFFRKSLIKKDLPHDEAVTMELLEELTYLPLAIAQAAAYLNMHKTSVAAYLRLLRNTEQDIVAVMSREFRDDTRYKGSANAVASTWVVSFSQLQAHEPKAAHLLSFMSCIEWKAIPRSILPVVQPEAAMEHAIGTLCAYSFLSKRDLDDDCYDMHRLVHQATRIWIAEHGAMAAMTEEAVCHVTEILPFINYENRPVWSTYLPHAQRLLDNTPDSLVKDKDELCLRVGQCLYVDGRITEAVRRLEESCRLRNTLDEEDPHRLLSQHELAGAYAADGQIKIAIELLEHVVTVEDRVLAEEHPGRLASQHELARAYSADGQIQKAVELLEHVVLVQEKVLAEEHPSRLTSQHELASVYEADGQIQKAIELLEHVVTVEEKVLAEEHPSRLTSQHELAGVYGQDGQIQRAVVLQEHVVTVRAKVLRDDHPDRLVSEELLADLYKQDGQIEKAIVLQEHVVTVRAKVLRDDHPR